jgi:hypothetical protein
LEKIMYVLDERLAMTGVQVDEIWSMMLVWSKT